MRALLLYRTVCRMGRSKRVIPMAKEAVKIDFGEEEQVVTPTPQPTVDLKKLQWETMNLAELSKLGSGTLKAITYQLTKTRATSTSQKPQLSEPDKSLILPQMQKKYDYLVMLKQYPVVKPGSLAELYDLALDENEDVVKMIKEVYRGLGEPQKLGNYMEPMFIKYLVGLARDFQRVGLQLKGQEVQVTSVKPIHLEYEFWVGVHRNRSKNKSADLFIVEEKKIQNPNNSLLMKNELNKQILLKSIIAKRRCKDFKTGIMIKALLEVMINNSRHYIKIEFEGPYSHKTNVISTIAPNYRVIDIDQLMHGNPTLQPAFRFY